MKHKNDLFFITKLNGKEKFSFRKISVGLVTVALGTTFFLASSNTVQAADQNNTDSNQNISKELTSNNSVETTQKQETSAENNSHSSDPSTKDNNSSTQSSLTSKNEVTVPTNQTNNLNEETNQNESTVSITGAKTNDSLIAGVTQGAINVHINNHATTPLTINHGEQVNVSINDKNNLLSFNVNPTKTSEFDMNRTDTAANKEFTFTYTGSDDGILSGFDATFPFNADTTATTQYYEKYGTYPDLTLPVTVTLPNKQSFTQNLPIKINPYEDKVINEEILHGFIIGPKVIWTPGEDGNPGANGVYTEYGANYTGPEPSAKADIPVAQQKDARLMQYAIDWNYGSATNPSLKPLLNVLAHIKFSSGQKILPSTIKVFKIPSNIKVVASDGQRISINDYYSKISTLPEDTNFENFLRNSISNDGREIVIDQKGDFTVNGEDYSKNGPYFIQLDTQLDTNKISDWINTPSSGPSISTPTTNENDWNPSGSGSTTNTFTQTYTNFKLDPTVDRIIKIRFIDENTNQEIPNSAKNIITATNSSVPNPTMDIIKDLAARHYVLDQEATEGKNSSHSENLTNYNIATQNFKLDSLNNSYNSEEINVKNTSPKYYVYLYHETKPQSQTSSVTETINYVYANGTKEGELAASPYTHTVTYTRNGIEDLVTNYIDWNSWTPDSTFNAVNSPIASDSAYRLIDPLVVPAIETNISENGEITTQNNLPLSYTVNYYVPEKATLHFYDDTDKQDLTAYLLQNNQAAVINDIYDKADNNSTKQAISFVGVDKVIDFLNSKHYVFSGVSGIGSTSSSDYSKISYGNFDDDETQDQNFVLHFKHETEPISDTKEVTETIHYLYEDNLPAANDVKHSVTFTKTGTKDLVTGKENSEWSAVQTFPEVVSPVIPGYTPTQSKIAPISVDHTSNDIDKTVIYTANKQQATLRFYDDSSKKFIDFAKDLTVTGSSSSPILFTIPKSYDFSNYNFVAVDKGDNPTQTTDSLSGTALNDVTYGKFDTDNTTDQYFIAHFTHKISPVNENKSISEKAILYAENGPRKDNIFKTLNLGNINFIRTGQKDLVNQQITWDAWNVENKAQNISIPEIIFNVYKLNSQNISQPSSTLKKFELNGPEISPIEFDKKQDQALITNLPNNFEFLIKVPYVLTENITVIYKDDTTNEILERQVLSGQPDTSSQYSTKNTITKYLAKNYLLVSDPTNKHFHSITQKIQTIKLTWFILNINLKK